MTSGQVPVVDDGVDLLGLLIWVGVPALSAAVVSIVGGYLAYRQSQTSRRQDAQDREIESLKQQVAELKAERDGTKELLRSAIHHIRDWLRWSVDMVAFVRQHAPGETPPNPPPLPENLQNEV